MGEVRNYLFLLTATAGGVVGYSLFEPSDLMIGMAFVILGFLVIGMNRLADHSNGHFSTFLRKAGNISILLFFTLAGACSAMQSLPRYVTDSPHFLVGERGRVTAVSHKSGFELLRVELSGRGCEAAVLSSDVGFCSGDQVKINCRLLPSDSSLKPETKAKPGSDSIGNSYAATKNYNGTLAGKDVLYTGFSNYGEVQIVGHEETFMTLIGRLRDSLEKFVEKTGLRRDTQDFLITILLGDKRFLHSDLRQEMAEVGLSHILAVSGLHTGIIALLILSVLRPFTHSGRRNMRYFIALVFLWIFVFITGLSPGTFRAAIMATCLFIGRISQRKGIALSSLCVAATFILIFTPSALFDPGFQLSFVCVASLCVFTEDLNPFDPLYHPLHRKIAGCVLPTLVTTGATWLIVAYYFGTVPTLFLPANLLILPFVPVYMLCAVIYLVLSVIGISSAPLGFILESGLDAVTSVSGFLSGGGDSVIHLQPESETVIIWLIGVAVAGWGLHSSCHRRPKIYASLVLFSVSVATLI